MPDLPAMEVPPNTTAVTLKEYVDTRLHALEERLDTRLEALEKLVQAALTAQATAIVKAETATEYRLQGMNEFRKSLEDQSNKQATKVDLEALRDTLAANINTVRVESNALSSANRIAAEIEAKAIWKVVYGLATAIAVIEAILRFAPK